MKYAEQIFTFSKGVTSEEKLREFCFQPGLQAIGMSDIEASTVKSTLDMKRVDARECGRLGDKSAMVFHRPEVLAHNDAAVGVPREVVQSSAGSHDFDASGVLEIRWKTLIEGEKTTSSHPRTCESVDEDAVNILGPRSTGRYLVTQAAQGSNCAMRSVPMSPHAVETFGASSTQQNGDHLGLAIIPIPHSQKKGFRHCDCFY